ncbi:MAG: hypothetical protein Q4D25_10575 [Bacteroidales bacterium]|nr:hypothetical protein [Bacteroidales bacterium]
MKPTRNKHFCNGCGHTKMLFESQSKADNFIKFNGEDILEETGRKPVRSYYCEFCGGYHVTSSDSSEVGERLNHRDHRVMDKVILMKKSQRDLSKLSNDLQQKLAQIRRFIINWKKEAAQEPFQTCLSEFEMIQKMYPLQRGKLFNIQHKIEAIQNVLNRWDELTHLSDEKIEEMIRVENSTEEDKLIASMLKTKREEIM